MKNADNLALDFDTVFQGKTASSAYLDGLADLVSQGALSTELLEYLEKRLQQGQHLDQSNLRTDYRRALYNILMKWLRASEEGPDQLLARIDRYAHGEKA